MVDEEWKNTNKHHAELLSEVAEKFNLADALGEYSRKLKRNLMVWSALLFVCKFYSLKLTSIPSLNVSIPETAPDALAVVVAVPLIYSFVAFIVQAAADLHQWRLNFSGDIARFRMNMIHTISHHMNTVGNVLSGTVEARGANPERVRELFDNSASAINECVALSASIITQARNLTRMRKWFAYVWELALPVVFALGTVVYAWHPLVAATKAVWFSFR